ncbi:hypothetical protein R5R35_000768 [Gryllus longicercus]|uniref:Transposase n=1 Tax=Gryllus longicercus TaxID=2509291 RepID=A0AAN9V3R4_9ORTH
MTSRHFCTEAEIQEIVTKCDSDNELFDFSDSDASDSNDSDSDDSSPDIRSTAQPSTSSDKIQLSRDPTCETFDSSTNQESSSEDEMSAKRAKGEFYWTTNDFHPFIHPHDETSGRKRTEGNETTILSFFMLFFTEELMKYIADETNKFFEYTMENTPESMHSRISKWKETNFQELYCFIAVCLLMARVKKLKISEYWSKDILLNTPVFSDLISRDRFLILLRMLHFSDNSMNTGGDSLFKIRTIIDKIRAAFGNALQPSQKLCIDESLLLFKGRLSFKQYIPSKRSRFGIKTFVLCDCQTGFVLDFIVYTGATTDIELHNLGKSGDIVATLLKPYLGRGHTLYVDNWYASPDLFLWLHEHATNACGTVRRNRRNMPKLEKKLKRGEMQSMSSDTMLGMKWCDKREVWMLTTCNTAEMIETNKVNRMTGEKIRNPQCVVDYNTSMGAVDRSDMILSSIQSVRKSVKWYKKFFFHILDLCVLNSHALHKLETGQNIPMAKFQLSLIRELIKKFSTERRKAGRGRRSEDENVLRFTGRHFPNLIPGDQSKKKSPRRRCVVCAKQNKRRETKYECKACNVALCAAPCFEIFHTKKKY